jgi:hypothetical protein
LIGRLRVETIPALSSRAVRILVGVIAIVVAIWIVGYTLFTADGSAPGTGTGESTTVPSTP